MGAWVNFTNHIHISDESYQNGVMRFVGYQDITPELIEEITLDQKLKWIQISQELPEKAYQAIDRILAQRPDLYFRIFSIYGDKTFDLSVLGQMPHLSKVWIEAHLRNNKDAVNVEYLCELPGLRGLHLDLFDRRDYGFLNHLSPDLEELVFFADTMGGAIQFDCEWILRYEKLRSLFLGKKAKKHLECIGKLPNLKSLSLRGIKVADFDFLKELRLDSFALLWCGNADLSGLGELKSLKELELWRIMKLENIDFISALVNLEVLKLQDLKHVTALPDLNGLKKLKEIRIDHVPIDLEALDESVRRLIRPV